MITFLFRFKSNRIYKIIRMKKLHKCLNVSYRSQKEKMKKVGEKGLNKKQNLPRVLLMMQDCFSLLQNLLELPKLRRQLKSYSSQRNVNTRAQVFSRINSIKLTAL